MASEDVIRKLSKLSQREREVLWLRCEGLQQKDISERLFISIPTVKNTMGRILVKLELDQLPQSQRTKEIFETYCPILKGEQLPPPPIEPSEPEAVTDEVSDMVEEDENALVVWQASRLPVVVSPPPSRTIPIPSQDPAPNRRRRARPLTWLIAGLILGIALMLGGSWLLNALREDGLGALPPTLGPTSPGAEEATVSTTAVPTLPSLTPIIEERVVTQVVTATPNPNLSTSTAVVEEETITQVVTLVVTATSPPTPTEPIVTPGDAVLEVGDWWKTDGVWLRVGEVDFTSEAEIYVLLEMWNQTNNQLIFTWTMAGNFMLTDNTGHVYDVNYGGGRQGDDESYEAGENKPFYLGPYGYTVSYSDRFLFNPSVTDLYLTVMNLSRVEHARFHFSVPK